MTRLRSAGAVVIAPGPEGPLVAVLHHRAHDQWRLPKGKLKPGESDEQAAVREVCEELGVSARLGEPIGETEYVYADPRSGLPVHKTVRFFLMFAADTGARIETRTFDDVTWLPPAQAQARLSFASEQGMVARAAEAYARVNR